MINYTNIEHSFKTFKSNKPFDHCVVTNFFDDNTAAELEKEFFEYNNSNWFYYHNQIEDKKTLNHWDRFPSTTYKVFSLLNSSKFVEKLSSWAGVALYPDVGLHGGGWHIHANGGNLNPHLDYNIHPKLGLQRKLNIIIYLSSQLKPEHGGHLGLWNGTETEPLNLEKEIIPQFNTAVIFDTTQNSWHGMSKSLVCPDEVYRKSIAVYYLCDAPNKTVSRNRALFALREDQKFNKDLQEFVKKRAGL